MIVQKKVTNKWHFTSQFFYYLRNLLLLENKVPVSKCTLNTFNHFPSRNEKGREASQSNSLPRHGVSYLRHLVSTLVCHFKKNWSSLRTFMIHVDQPKLSTPTQKCSRTYNHPSGVRKCCLSIMECWRESCHPCFSGVTWRKNSERDWIRGTLKN